MEGDRYDIKPNEEPKKYIIGLTKDAWKDIAQIKTYILTTYKYRETAEIFSENIRQAISKLRYFSEAYPKTGLQIQGYEVYYKPCKTYLIFSP